MARVQATACASEHAGTVLGIARSIAHPAYRRLITAEPWLRFAVPGLLAVFLCTLVASALTQVLAARRDASDIATRTMDLVATVTAHRLAAAVVANAGAIGEPLELLERALPAEAFGGGRFALLTDASGTIVAAAPRGIVVDGTLLDQLGQGQPLTTLADHAGVLSLVLPGGHGALATVRNLLAPFGQVAFVQPMSGVLAEWRSKTWAQATLLMTVSAVLVFISLAYFMQAARARAADDVCDRIKRRLDAALNRGHCGLWDWDIARGRIYWSDSIYSLLGYDRHNEFLSFGEVNALVHPEDGDLYGIADLLAGSATTAVDREFRIRRANGDWVWLRARAELVEGNDGQEGPHLVGIAVDVSEERRLAERNKTANDRLGDAIDALSEACVLWDADNRLVTCNTKFQNLHGLTADAVAPGRLYADIMHAARPPCVQRQVLVGERREIGARTFEALLADGRWLQIDERRTKDGGYVSVGTDITALKRNERELLASERRLLDTVANLHRSRRALETQKQELVDLAQRYREQKAEAESANRTKAEFLANMNHELRTPLNAILGFSEVMVSGVFGALGSPKYEEYCRDIRTSGEQLLSLVSDILDMSRIEAGRVRLDKQEVAVDAVISEALQDVVEEARVKSLSLGATQLPATRIHADPHVFYRILINLLRNAVKFTPEGGSVRVRPRPSGGGVNIFVEDTGIGIPAEAVRKLGTPFAQVETEFNKSYKGSGLGLAIAKSLAEMHGGGLRIRSGVGVGTIVLVRLPGEERSEALETAARI